MPRRALGPGDLTPQSGRWKVVVHVCDGAVLALSCRACQIRAGGIVCARRTNNWLPYGCGTSYLVPSGYAIVRRRHGVVRSSEARSRNDD